MTKVKGGRKREVRPRNKSRKEEQNDLNNLNVPNWKEKKQ